MLYEKESEGFDLVLDLLTNIDIVSIKKDQLFLIRNVPLDKKTLKPFLARRIVEKQSTLPEIYANFLSNFHYSKYSWEFTPSNREKLFYGEIRNLFIDLGIIRVQRNKYLINNDLKDLFTQSFNTNVISPDQLELSRKEKEELGRLAELKVLDDEKLRLRGENINRKVEHTSKMYVDAGYDIKSWDIISNEIQERFIEVKAISNHYIRFYWSRNEIRVAQRLGDRYFLYLVPCVNNQIIDNGDIIIIQNPYHKVFKNDNSWIKEVENYLLFRKQ